MVPKVKTYNSAKAIKKAKRQMAGLKQRHGKPLTGMVPKIGPELPDERNPVIIRLLKRSELAAIPRDRYDIRVLKVRVPLLETGEVGGEEELVVAITDTMNLAKQLKKLRQNLRNRLRNNGGGGDGPSSSGIFNSPINEDLMSDCILGVMEDFFQGDENCTICNREYGRMDFCVLMHIYFKYIGFLKNESRLSYSTFLQEKVFVSKSKFGKRTFNTYANKASFKILRKQLENLEVDFKKHPKLPPDSNESILKPAFQEIGYAFQHSSYITDLIELRNDLQKFKI